MKKKNSTYILLEYKRWNTSQPILWRQHYSASKSRQNHFKTKKNLQKRSFVFQVSIKFPIFPYKCLATAHKALLTWINVWIHNKINWITNKEARINSHCGLRMLPTISVNKRCHNHQWLWPILREGTQDANEKCLPSSSYQTIATHSSTAWGNSGWENTGCWPWTAEVNIKGVFSVSPDSCISHLENGLS